MIGTLGWNVLVTSCIILTSGKVIVDPDNSEFHPDEHSHIWIRRDSGQVFYNNLERQTHSKFNIESTFESYVAADRISNFYKTILVTLKSLWDCLVKSRGRKAATCQILDIVDQMADVMADVETIPVSDEVNKCLTELGGKVQGEVAGLNKTKVSKPIESRIHMMLLAK
ncbi:hypothetical protein BGZ47_002717 [Haplosporangium gracile]|nr:hypothetical protein BGZ47_002717 [Haplosporangium gracile]